MRANRLRGYSVSMLFLLAGGFLSLGWLLRDAGPKATAAPVPDRPVPAEGNPPPKRVQEAVRKGLAWLALHQAHPGRWSLDGFNEHGRAQPFPAGKTFRCNCTGMATRRNDVAATALALLPFLAAGHTHKAAPKNKEDADYRKTVLGGLQFLLSKQDKDGKFTGDMYTQGLAAWALGEAYGLTSDPLLKGPAQKAIDFIVKAQDPAGGGWRYAPRTPGDLSVTGYEMHALKAAQVAGLDVPAATMRQAEKFLTSCLTETKGYSYVPGGPSSSNMTAVGLLSSLYLGVNPRNADLRKGLDLLKQNPPGRGGQLYYDFHALQAVQHADLETFKTWCEGSPRQRGMQEVLVLRQDRGTDPKTNHQAGSWGPDDMVSFGREGGRIMTTSLSLLSLEMSYGKMAVFNRPKGER